VPDCVLSGRDELACPQVELTLEHDDRAALCLSDPKPTRRHGGTLRRGSRVCATSEVTSLRATGQRDEAAKQRQPPCRGSCSASEARPGRA
jgi:hypothetical protein